MSPHGLYKGLAAANQQKAAGNRPRLTESGPIPVWQMPQERQEHGQPTHVESEGRASKNPLWILQFLSFREETPEAKIIGEHWGVADSACRPLSNPPKRETYRVHVNVQSSTVEWGYPSLHCVILREEIY